uniref:Poly (ADP-ribose) polymerase family, member 9 n=1 Tax=Cricetulus griseus TaxID=10029 RepID=A0A8C2MLU9_CRIGR
MTSSAFAEHNRWQIPIKHNVFEILKSNEGQLCKVLQNKFGCVSTLSSPRVARNSAPAQQVFRRMLTPWIELSVWKDDLTRHVVDAVVNAANEELWHGGGLAGSLVKAGGFEIQEESKRFIATYGKVPTGQIAVTRAGRLPCNWIIHAVGPRWTGSQTSIDLLRAAIKNTLDYVCIRNTHIKTVAIPALSSGIFQFPLDLCTHTILETISLYFQGKQPISYLKEIHLVSNEDRTVASFKDAAENILGKMELSPSESPGTTPSSNVMLQIGQGQTLQIVQGCIELQTTDVIVNSGFLHDLKSGSVSQSIVKQAGLEMERELDKVNLSSDYQMVLVTKGFKLSCQYVFHVAWKFEKKQQILKDAVKTCLEKCLQLDVNSISFPALGTGLIEIEKSTAAMIMVDEILAFFKMHMKKTLTVRIVIFPVDVETYTAFCAEMMKRSNELSLSSNSETCATTAQKEFASLNLLLILFLCVLRALKQGFCLPPFLGQWTNKEGKLDEMEKFHTYLRYPVPLTQELEDRKRQFEKCGLWVVKVEQIQNNALMAAFLEKKKMMEERTPRGPGSQRLFQQVPYQFCNVVCKVGFHRLYSTPHGRYQPHPQGCLHGQGKETSVYSCGEGSFGNNLIITPPPLSPGALDVHDSVVDNVSNPETVVVFNGMQALPQYLWICTQDRTLLQHQMWGQDYSSGLAMVSSPPQSWLEVSYGSTV